MLSGSRPRPDKTLILERVLPHLVNLSLGEGSRKNPALDPPGPGHVPALSHITAGQGLAHPALGLPRSPRSLYRLSGVHELGPTQVIDACLCTPSSPFGQLTVTVYDLVSRTCSTLQRLTLASGQATVKSPGDGRCQALSLTRWPGCGPLAAHLKSSRFRGARVHLLVYRSCRYRAPGAATGHTGRDSCSSGRLQ